MEFSGWKEWAYVGACVLVPILWGGLTAWLFTRGDGKRDAAEQRPPIDYMI